MMKKADVDYTLYLCTDRKLIGTETLEQTVEQAVKGGCSVVQLREKNCSTREFLTIAEHIKSITTKYQVPFIINDRIDIMLAVDADGVHLGQEDMPVAKARELIGEEKIIGCSAHNLKEAVQAWKDGADYLGVGAIFGTSTKADASNTSIETLKEICDKVKLPVVAIGGINAANVEALAKTGIHGAAVVSAVMAAKNKKEAAEVMRMKVREVLNEGI